MSAPIPPAYGPGAAVRSRTHKEDLGRVLRIREYPPAVYVLWQTHHGVPYPEHRKPEWWVAMANVILVEPAEPAQAGYL